jgi:hypothetical protein
MKDNVVGTVTRVRATRTVVRIAADANEFPLLQNAEISLLFGRYWGLFPPALKSSGHEDDPSPTSTAEVPDECSSTSAIPVCIYGA